MKFNLKEAPQSFNNEAPIDPAPMPAPTPETPPETPPEQPQPGPEDPQPNPEPPQPETPPEINPETPDPDPEDPQPEPDPDPTPEPDESEKPNPDEPEKPEPESDPEPNPEPEDPNFNPDNIAREEFGISEEQYNDIISQGIENISETEYMMLMGKILGASDINPDSLKRVYRDFVKKFHPDANGNSEKEKKVMAAKFNIGMRLYNEYMRRLENPKSNGGEEKSGGKKPGGEEKKEHKRCPNCGFFNETYAGFCEACQFDFSESNNEGKKKPKPNEKPFDEDIEIKSIEKEKLEEIMKEYEEDPDNFYQKNSFVLWDEGKNPALMVSIELASKFIREVWEERNLGKADKILNEARTIAMFVMKYLGADIEGWCKVDPETAVEVNNQMGENNFQENCKFILEKIKRNDPVFAEFLTKLCVRDLKTDEIRSEIDTVTIVTMINLVVRTMYEQMLKDAKMN